MNLATIMTALQGELAAGDDMAQQLVDRIDAHIRDLETLKAWVRHAAVDRATALCKMLGDETTTVPVVAAPEPPPQQDEAA